MYHRSQYTRLLHALVTIILLPLEYLLTARRPNEYPPVCFIVGPPRSGTTLTYELITQSFQCSYITNHAKRLYKTPVAATWLILGKVKHRKPKYESNFGEIEGAASPSEAGKLWYYYYPHWAPSNQTIDEARAQKIKAKLSAISKMMKGPLIVKNPVLQSALKEIKAEYKRAIYIHVERDWYDNAASILHMMETKTAVVTKHGWASTQPSGWCEFKNRNSAIIACAQVALCHLDIQKTLENEQENGKILHINYSDLCMKPEKILEEVEVFFKNNGFQLRRRSLIGEQKVEKFSEARQPTAVKQKLQSIIMHNQGLKNLWKDQPSE